MVTEKVSKPAKGKKYSFDDYPEDQQKLKPWADKWIANAFSCEAITPEQWAKTETSVREIYAIAKLPEAESVRVVYAPSPLSAAIAAGISAGIWYLRDNEKFAKELADADSTYAVRPRQIEDRMPQVISKATHAAAGEAHDMRNSDAVCAAFAAASAKAMGEGESPVEQKSKTVEFLLACVGRSFNMRNGGNQWSGWPCYLSFGRHVGRTDIDYSKFDAYEYLAHVGPRYMHPKFCIVSDRFEALKVDEQGRPHCANGPSHRWRDGWELYHWRGVKVPKEWILSPGLLDPIVALNWPNIEERRAAAEIVGWGRIMEKLNPRVIDKDQDPEIGELLEVDIPDSGKERFLRVRCGTGRDFVLPVDPDSKTALEANARTFRLKPEELLESEVRT